MGIRYWGLGDWIDAFLQVRKRTFDMMKLRLLLLLLGIQGSVYSQKAKVAAGTLVRIDSFLSNYIGTKKIDIWLPPGYPSAGPYDVLYLQDGQMLFDSTVTWNKQEWQADETAAGLQAKGSVRPFLIVGIWNGGTLRRAEYFPQGAVGSISRPLRDSLLAEMASPPLADRYLSFLVHELKPYVDRKLATNPGRTHTFIGGSSMGGLISLYALCRYPQVFGGAACLSTHWPGSIKHLHSPIPDVLVRFFSKQLPPAGRHLLYFDHGNQTLDSLYPPLQARADRMFRGKGFRAPFLQSHFFPGTAHTERAWAARLPAVLMFLFGRERK